jgi:hypothetical protein
MVYSSCKNGLAIGSAEPGEITTIPGHLQTTKPNDLDSSVVLNGSSGSKMDFFLLVQKNQLN